MSGSMCQFLRGIAAASCAAMTCGFALGAGTFQLADSVDFSGILSTNVSPIRDASDVDAAVIPMATPVSFRSVRSLSLEDLPPDLGLSTKSRIALDLAAGTVDIDAGQIEATDAWNALLDRSTGWRTSREESAGDPQTVFFSATSGADAAPVGFASNVSVIPLPAALTSAATTVGLVGGLWVVRRYRKQRSTH